jgi:OFA family oxalate/formate antiporter-like MFS transporter
LVSVSKIRDRIFYGWIVVLAIIVSNFVMMGVTSSFGVFFKSFENAFGLTRATTSAILSGRMVFSCVFAFAGGWAIDRYGPRIVFSVMGFFIGVSFILTGLTNAAWQLFITYSLLLAIGVGATYVVTSSTILRWFSRKRGLALGIAGAGGGLGMVFLAPFAAYLIESLDWHKALVILGGIAWLFMLPVARLLKKDPYEIGTLPDGDMPDSSDIMIEETESQSEKLTLLQTLQTANFWFFIFIWVMMAFCWFFVLTHIVPHATDLGFSAVEAATIVSLTGIAMTTGRLGIGIITDRISARLAAILCSLLGALLWLIWADELWMLYLFGLISGFTLGGFGTATTVLIGEAFGLSDIGKILGMLEIGFSIGAAIGPFLGGLIFDISGSYRIAFLITAGTVLVRCLLVALIRREAGQANTLREK